MKTEHRIDSPYTRLLRLDDNLIAPYGGVLVQAFVPAHDRLALLERLSALPRLQISASELFDLEMLAAGAFSPLQGFMTQDSYTSVLANAALPDGRPWGLPVTLAVTRDMALTIRTGQEIALYRNDYPVGIMQVDEIFPWDAVAEARALRGSDDLSDAHTAARLARKAAWLVGGPVAFLAARGATFVENRHAWPLELRGQFAQHGWAQVAVPHVKHPWRRTHEYLLKCALEASDALLLHTPADKEPVVSAKQNEQVLADASALLVENYFPAQRILQNPIPAGMFDGGVRATLQHAILSQNYGANLFFLPEATPPETQEIRTLFNRAARHGLSIRPAFMPSAFHCEPCGGIATDKSCPHPADQHVSVSDDEVIERLCQGQPVSPLIARPDVARALARSVAEHLSDKTLPTVTHHIHPHAPEVSQALRQTMSGHKACVLWMTGLSGSGKSTIAHRLERELLLGGHRVYVLDGDTLRHGLNHDLGFSEADRRENLRRAAEVVKIMTEAGLIVIASFISPFRVERQMVRDIVGANFREVYVEASLEACEQRDPKGLYKRARSGQIPQFTGISSPYEAPENPDVRLNTTTNSVEQCIAQLREFLTDNGILRAARGDVPVSGRSVLPGPGRFRVQ